MGLYIGFICCSCLGPCGTNLLWVDEWNSDARCSSFVKRWLSLNTYQVLSWILFGGIPTIMLHETMGWTPHWFVQFICISGCPWSCTVYQFFAQPPSSICLLNMKGHSKQGLSSVNSLCFFQIARCVSRVTKCSQIHVCSYKSLGVFWEVTLLETWLYPFPYVFCFSESWSF